MNLETRKIAFVQEFLRIQREDVVERLEKLLKEETQTKEDDSLGPMTSEELNARIDKSLEDSKEGRRTKAEDFKRKINKWS